MQLSFVLLVVLAKSAVTFAADPHVTLEQGVLRGRTMTSRKGKSFFAFQGIPYAAPPIGDLRFTDPQEPPSWPGELVAKREGNACLQLHMLLSLHVGSEDCLYLNVYTPKVTHEGGGLDVMVYVHGGGFLMGSGSTELFGPHFLLDHDVILITFNYRIGALGFLSLGTPEAPGNYGLKDQVAALRWVQNNIAKFGGNPDSVTIFGESAGGASIHYLMLSPLARGLFHRAIAQSGSAHNPWTLVHDAARHGFEVAADLGCQHHDPHVVIICLREVDAKRLAKLAFTKVRKSMWTDSSKRTLFVPTIEPVGTKGAFITEDPRSMLEWGNITDVPLMAGLMTHEGLLHVFGLEGRTPEQDVEENHARFVPAERLGVARGSPEEDAAWHRIEHFYRTISDDFMDQYILINSDVDFVLGVDEMVRGVAALRRSPVYYYQFSYDGGLGLIKKFLPSKRPGTAHADELGYLFSQNLKRRAFWLAIPRGDQLTIDRMTKMWTDFAKTGNPTPDGQLGVRWDPVDAPLHEPKMATTRYLDIGEQLVMKEENLNGERVTFWQNLLEENQSSLEYYVQKLDKK